MNPMDHIGLVRREARKWRWALCSILEESDLEQAGLLGVMRAAETFDPERGRFSTYATPWIRHYIQTEVYSQVRSVRVPMNVAKEAYKSGAPIELTTLSLDASPVEGFCDRHYKPDGEDYCEEQDRKELVAHLLSTLPEREASVLRMRFYDDMTLHEVGRKLRVTRERARQIEAKALRFICYRLEKEERGEQA